MNYGEDLAYWYLRLNGFFPISNFVVHAGEQVKHTADVDVLAVRPAHVYEEVGGRGADWDANLTDVLPFDRPLGVICEVKTGGFERDKLFLGDRLRYTLPRLGFAPESECDKLCEKLAEAPLVELGDGGCIAKLFISQEAVEGPFLNRTLPDIENFLNVRIEKYSIQKYAARMFFPSQLLQHVIDRVSRAKKG